MAEPTVTVAINTGTELVPVWTTLVSPGGTVSRALYFGGNASTVSWLEPIEVPQIAPINAGTMWVSTPQGFQAPTGETLPISIYVPPTALVQVQNIMQVSFVGAATVNPPFLTAWDDSTMTTTAKQCIAGTAQSGNTGYFKATESTLGAPVQNWCLIGTTNPGGNIINELNGNANFCQCALFAPAGGVKKFVIAMFIPNDAYLTGAENNIVFELEYDWI